MSGPFAVIVGCWCRSSRCGRRAAAAAAVVLHMLTWPAWSAGELIARWGFPDQGPASNANLSATASSPNASAGAVQVGSGYSQLVQKVSGVDYSYVDATQNSGTATLPSGAAVNTDNRFYMVGDWNGGASGGNIFAGNTGVSVEPSGSGPAGPGALYLSSPPGAINDVAEAVANNLGITFAVTASGGSWQVTNFSFYGTRDSADASRSWQNWHLQVDTGAGFTTLFSSALNAIPATESWGLTAATPFSVTIPNGSTATFRLLGTSIDTALYGRETALDDLTLEGTFTPVPEPATCGLVGLGACAVLLRARSRRPHRGVDRGPPTAG